MMEVMKLKMKVNEMVRVMLREGYRKDKEIMEMLKLVLFRSHKVFVLVGVER